MTPRFSAAVSALTYSVILARCGEIQPATANRATDYILGSHERLPDFMRLPLRLATLGLDASTLLTTGKPLHQLPHPQRWRRIQRWRESRLGVFRSLLRFYEGLALFAWYAEIHGDAIEPPNERKI